jgi:excisionase family DNA binding protein
MAAALGADQRELRQLITAALPEYKRNGTTMSESVRWFIAELAAGARTAEPPAVEPIVGPFVSVSHAAHELGVSTRRIRQLIAANDLRSVQLKQGAGHRIPAADVTNLGADRNFRGIPISVDVA